jgi:hypothetical protein
MNPEDESLVREFLLGGMSSGQREVFDERLIGEPDLVEQTEALEGELIRDALLGALSSDDQSRFERHFLSYPHLREKYELTRAMLIARGNDVASLRAALPPPVRRAPRRPASAFDLWKLSLVGAAVAIVILVWQDLNLRSHLQQLAGVAALPARSAVASFLLKPGQERRGETGDAGQTPKALPIPADAGTVRLQLEFEAAERHEAYTVIVNAVDHTEQAWGREGLGAVPAGAMQNVTAEIPASSLPPGDYIVLLQTPERPKDPIVETYTFRVARPAAR